MTDITDQDRRVAHEWAASIDPEMDCWSASTRAVARIVLATVDAPEPTLAEELRYRADLLDNGDPDGDTPQALRALADRAEQMEQDAEDRQEWNRNITKQVATLARERDEARAEAERLTAERDGAREEIAWLRNGPGHTEVATDLPDPDDGHTERPDDDWIAGMKDATRYAVNATLTPADVQPGEAWLVEVNREKRTAVKDSDAGIPWNTVNTSGVFHAEYNEDITLITRLVPAPRTITNHDDLDRLTEGAVILSVSTQYALQHGDDGDGWYGTATDRKAPSSEALSGGPATVLWEPEV